MGNCPNKPIDLLLGWNEREYVEQSSTHLSPGHPLSTGSEACLALPVLTRDRDARDPRNQKLSTDGLTPKDLRLLHRYAGDLERRGFRSFHEHLRMSGACAQRQRQVSAGHF